MADEKVRITRFDAWFFRAMRIGLLAAMAFLAVYVAVIAIDIATSGRDGAGRQAGVLLAIQAVLMVTLAWAAIRTPRQWRALAGRAADAPHVATGRHRMIGWLRTTWRKTDPEGLSPPPPRPDDSRLRAAGLGDDAIKRLRANPRAFPHTLRRLGFSFGGGVRGKGFVERTVGAAHCLWSRLA